MVTGRSPGADRAPIGRRSGGDRVVFGWCSGGASGRGRTGMTLRPTDFRTHDGFRRRASLRVRSLECATTLAARHRTAVRSPPSTLYTCRRRFARTGLARRYRGRSRPRGFADFDGIQRGVSVPAAQIFKSVASTNFATEAHGGASVPPITRQCAAQPACTRYRPDACARATRTAADGSWSAARAPWTPPSRRSRRTALRRPAPDRKGARRR